MSVVDGAPIVAYPAVPSRDYWGGVGLAWIGLDRLFPEDWVGLGPLGYDCTADERSSPSASSHYPEFGPKIHHGDFGHGGPPAAIPWVFEFSRARLRSSSFHAHRERSGAFSGLIRRQ